MIWTYPTPEKDDPDDLALALDTGAKLWREGKPDEALRWLRRATDSAEQAGLTERAATLLAATEHMHGPTAAPAADAARTEGSVPPQASRPAPPRASPSAALSGGLQRPPPGVRLSRPPPPPSALRRASSTPAPPPAAPRPSAPQTRASSESQAPPAATSTPPASAEPTGEPAAPRSPASAHPASAASASEPAAIGPQGASAPTAVPQNARRVAIKQSVRDDSLWVARELAEGAALPPGTQLGWVILPGEG